MKLIPTSCQLPWQQHWLTEEFRSWTSSKRSPGSSWGEQTFGVWIHWLSIRFRTSLEWHPLKFKQPSSILRGIHIFGNQRRPLIANFMARLNAVNGQKGYIVVLLRNTQCASLRIAYKNIFLWKKSSFHWNIESLLCKTYFSIVKYVSKVNSMHPRCEMLIWMRHIRSKMWKATDSSW